MPAVARGIGATRGNGDADRLSHPDMLPAVAAEAEHAGLGVRVVGIPEECWEVLREAAVKAAEKKGDATA
eukprot:4788148-Pleurochrysis_carterae.AAC.1